MPASFRTVWVASESVLVACHYLKIAQQPSAQVLQRVREHGGQTLGAGQQ